MAKNYFLKALVMQADGQRTNAKADSYAALRNDKQKCCGMTNKNGYGMTNKSGCGMTNKNGGMTIKNGYGTANK